MLTVLNGRKTLQLARLTSRLKLVRWTSFETSLSDEFIKCMKYNTFLDRTELGSVLQLIKHLDEVR